MSWKRLGAAAIVLLLACVNERSGAFQTVTVYLACLSALLFTAR